MLAHHARVEESAVALSVSELGGADLARWLLLGVHLEPALDPLDHAMLVHELDGACAATRHNHLAHLLPIFQTDPAILLTDLPPPAVLELVDKEMLDGVHGSDR